MIHEASSHDLLHDSFTRNLHNTEQHLHAPHTTNISTHRTKIQQESHTTYATQPQGGRSPELGGLTSRPTPSPDAPRTRPCSSPQRGCWGPSSSRAKAKRKISITVGDAQKASDVVLVGIHIRLGDYQNYLKKRYDVKNWSYDKYLRGAVGYFTRKYAKVRFIATSDDGLAAKKILRKIDKNITLIASGSAAEAMCLLSMCHHNILTFGTFSFWIGFLGRGVALYPDLRFPQRQYLLSRHTYDRAKLHDFLPIPLQ